MDLDLSAILVLSGSGFLAGIINTLAGSGSNLTLPALMMLGLPADVANGTNRVAVLMQSVVGVAGFDKHQRLDRPAIVPILIPTIIGGVVGAIAAALLPNLYLKPVLLLAILTVSVVMLLRPSIVSPLISPLSDTPTLAPTDSRLAWWGLFSAGVYGGFVQAGVGFILLAALSGGLRYDLVWANALKMTCTLAFTVVAVVIFAWFDLIRWLPGLILAGGTMSGAHLAVKFAVQASQNTLKWLLFVMTLFVVAGGFFL